MHPEISYIEIGSSDAVSTGGFLERLFGCSFNVLGSGGEGWFQTPTMKVGLHGKDPSPGFLVFFGVSDLDAAVSRVSALGGNCEAPTEEPGFGKFCICTDPSGLKFGLHQRSSD